MVIPEVLIVPDRTPEHPFGPPEDEEAADVRTVSR
jgi:hypothetical protein